jgi:hypothetical protein
MVCRPHEPEGARFTPEQFAVYRQGYDVALVMALRVMDLADRRYRLATRTKQLEAMNER